MTAEGWDGKSIREHVEHAEAEAGRAVEIAEAVEARLSELGRRLGVCEAITEVPPLDAELLSDIKKGARN